MASARVLEPKPVSSERRTEDHVSAAPDRSAPNSNARPAALRQATSRPMLWSIQTKEGIRYDCELRDYGSWGVEVHICCTVNKRDFRYARRWPLRELAIAEADEILARELREGATRIP
jgi:hypothetical protein